MRKTQIYINDRWSKGDKSVDSSVSQTSFKTELDGEDIDLDEINSIEGDRTKIGSTSKK